MATTTATRQTVWMIESMPNLESLMKAFEERHSASIQIGEYETRGTSPNLSMISAHLIVTEIRDTRAEPGDQFLIIGHVVAQGDVPFVLVDVQILVDKDQTLSEWPKLIQFDRKVRMI